MKVAAIIPARYASTRFPGKVLTPIAGKPMIQRVWERVSLAERVDEVVVATDDQRVFDAVMYCGGHAVMTSPEHKSGTERCAQASEKLEADVIINVQGDEPIIDPASLDMVAGPLIDSETLPMSSLKHPILGYHEFMDPNVVKVVCDDQDNAVYFSRLPIPYYRESAELLEAWKSGGPPPEKLLPAPMKHIGVYAYRTEFLQAIARLPESWLEAAERLEQLRVLAWGFKICVVTTPEDSVSVDVPEDVERVERLIEKMGL